ncbi:MAG: AraC family transcriptional regulator [Microscillaceae bacterium]|nr:AraC family transcriptional regulator [Microscillaceae bacterium]
MKIVFEDIKSRQGKQSFVAYAFTLDYFKFNLHYHPEYELTYIAQGKGERLIGKVWHTFEAGDLVLLGKNIAHTWTSQEVSSAIVVQFSEELMQHFLPLAESKNVATLLEKAQQGLCFEAPESIIQTMHELLTRNGLKKMLCLLDLLDDLAQLAYTPITQEPQTVFSPKTESRINTVCQYIQKNFAQNMDLKQVASLVHLSESAFCKFFKKATQKTFSEYLNFIRIQAVCKALDNTDKTIAEIAYQNGFENIAYFNRVFKHIKDMTPKAYRQKGSDKIEAFS